MDQELVWEAPPPATAHGYDWAEIARTLKANPTAWLKVFDDGPTSAVNAIRQAQVTALTPVRPSRGDPGTAEGFEVRTRNNRTGPPRMCTLYLRWVPANTIGGE